MVSKFTHQLDTLRFKEEINRNDYQKQISDLIDKIDEVNVLIETSYATFNQKNLTKLSKIRMRLSEFKTKKQVSYPTGCIILWSGAIVDIPAGWVLCDGSNSTPDLRDRFVQGAGDTTAAGTIGGSTSHNHGIRTVTYWAAQANYGALSSPTATVPPYYALAYIMKV